MCTASHVTHNTTKMANKEEFLRRRNNFLMFLFTVILFTAGLVTGSQPLNGISQNNIITFDANDVAYLRGDIDVDSSVHNVHRRDVSQDGKCESQENQVKSLNSKLDKSVC